jgi:hypothetical protein
MNKRKIPITFTVIIILLSCFVVMVTATAQTPQVMQPPDFNGTFPPNGNGNMTRPPDFNGSLGFGNGGMQMPDFNGTMPRPSGSPGEMNGQLNPQTSSNQTIDMLYVIVGVAATGVVVAVIAVVLIRKRKARQLVSKVSSQSTGNNFDVSLYKR